MYCSACGTPLAPGLSYCNRCGMSLKERSESKTGLVSAYLTSITIVGIAGLSLMLGGAIALRNGALFGEDIVGIFMLMTFFLVALIEFFLCRQLSRISRASENSQSFAHPTPAAMPGELRPPQARALAEPLTSVTENTTRTLEYSRHEPSN
jgi:predicted nucleic acid-binding Zn ribbon protein